MLIAGVNFSGDFGRLNVALGFRYENSNSPNNQEIVLVDETANGVNSDFNLDGRFQNNAPIITDVDYSRQNLRYAAQASFQILEELEVGAGYRQRDTHYDSQNPLDVNHYRQQEVRRRAFAELEWRFIKRWRARLRYMHVMDTEFDRDIVSLSVAYRFKTLRLDE